MAKLNEEHRQTQKLCLTLDQERDTHGTKARDAGRVAQKLIMVEGREGSPLGLPRASQKITAAALLIRAMPEPSTLESWRGSTAGLRGLYVHPTSGGRCKGTHGA